MTKTFKEYLESFTKIFMDEFTAYSDMDSHLQNLRLCFQKCKEYGISLNANKSALILVSPNLQVEFHVHTNGSLLLVGAMLFHNLIGKNMFIGF